jgi:UPF0755 protein
MRFSEIGKLILQKLLSVLSFLESGLRKFENSRGYKYFLSLINKLLKAVFKLIIIISGYIKSFFRYISVKLEEKEIGLKLAGILLVIFRFFRKVFDKAGFFTVKKPFIIFPAISLFYLTIIAFIIYTSLFGKYYWEEDSEKRFSVKPRKNLTEIANELEQNNIIKNAFVFKIIVKLSGKEEKIIARNYVFKNGMNNLELLSILTDNSGSIKFRVPEGITVKQISKLVESKLQLSGEKFLQATLNDSLFIMPGMNGKIKNLEGFLFPDTYFLPAAIDEETLVEILLKEFMRKVVNNSEIQDKLKQYKTDLLSVITLASIIEAETPIKSEMPTISGVYHNRLNKKMKLQADPTVQYVLPGGPKARLLFEDLKIDSPYNTYKYFGLPPGPINNPGLAAIMAALNPEKHNYLFFVATGTGGHKFSVTYQEHQKAIKEYRGKQK